MSSLFKWPSLISAFLMLSMQTGCTAFDNPGNFFSQEESVIEAPVRCETYCDVMAQICIEDNAKYDDRQDCLQQCSGFQAVDTNGDGRVIFDEDDPNADATLFAGNTVNCRTHHARLAASNPATHCGHAAAVSEGFCVVTQCDEYCAALFEQCPDGGGWLGDDEQPSLDVCLTLCQGEFGDTENPVVACWLDALEARSCGEAHRDAEGCLSLDP